MTPNNYPAQIRGTLRDAVTYLLVEHLANTEGWTTEQSNDVFRLPLSHLLSDQRRLMPCCGSTMKRTSHHQSLCAHCRTWAWHASQVTSMQCWKRGSFGSSGCGAFSDRRPRFDGRVSGKANLPQHRGAVVDARTGAFWPGLCAKAATFAGKSLAEQRARSHRRRMAVCSVARWCCRLNRRLPAVEHADRRAQKRSIQSRTKRRQAVLSRPTRRT